MKGTFVTFLLAGDVRAQRKKKPGWGCDTDTLGNWSGIPSKGLNRIKIYFIFRDLNIATGDLKLYS